MVTKKITENQFYAIGTIITFIMTYMFGLQIAIPFIIGIVIGRKSTLYI
jgi:hypothetical protein